MKHFDRSRFANAFEQPPLAFHHTVEQALRTIDTQPVYTGLPSRRRLAVLIAVLVICLIGVAAAVLHGATLDDFLNINLQERGVPVVDQFALQGAMTGVDVTVKEAASDGMSMFLTVEYAMKDEDSAIVFGRDMEYVMDPARAHQVLPNHLEIAAAKSAKTLYWLTTEDFSCQDRQGVEHSAWNTLSLYPSASTVVVMYWFDLRAEDAFDAFIEPVTAGFPESLIVSIAPKLYVYQENAEIRTPDGPDSYVSLADFTQVEAGQLRITASPQRSAEQKKWRIADFPEQIAPLGIVDATVTETPLLYCIRLDFRWLEGQPLREYHMLADLLDEQGEPMEYLSMSHRANLEANGRGDVDFRLEAVYPKQDGRSPSTLVLESEWGEGYAAPVEVKWALLPME